MDPRTASSIYASIACNPTTEGVIWQPLWNDALIARSRSLLATDFLETDADVMVIVDDDIVWNPVDFWKLVEGARESRSIYCGPFVTRSATAHLASRMLPNTPVEIINTPQRRPMEIEYAATGFVAIHRDVFERLLEGEFRDADGVHRIHKATKGGGRPFYPFFAPFTLLDCTGEYHYLSEDWAFCERARQLGFKVWMDQSIILEHMGWYPFTVADLARPDSPLPSTGSDIVEIPGMDRKTGDPILDTLIEDIAEYFEENVGDVRRMMATATADLARLWETKPETESEEDWYRRDDVGMLYVLDLAAWHLRGGGVPSALIRRIGPHSRVLDWGAGIGTASLRVANREAIVVAEEPNDTMRYFLFWRAEKHRQYGRVLSPDRDEELGYFDAIIAWHVFEHVADPVAELANLCGRMAEGGYLITDSDFDKHDDHPMHHVRDDWELVLARHGFRRIEPGVYARD